MSCHAIHNSKLESKLKAMYNNFPNSNCISFPKEDSSNFENVPYLLQIDFCVSLLPINNRRVLFF